MECGDRLEARRIARSITWFSKSDLYFEKYFLAFHSWGFTCGVEENFDILKPREQSLNDMVKAVGRELQRLPCIAFSCR